VAGGGTETVTGQTVVRGSNSITNETITNPAGEVYHDRIVISHNGNSSQTETNTTRGPGGSIMTVKSTTSTLLNPNQVGQIAAQAILSLPVAAAAAHALNLEAQVLTLGSGTNSVGHSPSPVPLPEPSTLSLPCIVLGAALLRRGWKRLTTW
jgi:hypothetical protein